MSSRQISLRIHLGDELVEIGKIHYIEQESFGVVDDNGVRTEVIDEEIAVLDVGDGSYLGRMVDANLGMLLSKEVLQAQLQKKLDQNAHDQAERLGLKVTETTTYRTMFGE